MPTLRRLLLPLLLLCLAVALPVSGHAQLQPVAGISVDVAPPPLPVYAEPPLPDDGYIFIPGYWAWTQSGYYWVPGTWVEPPSPGLLWTPGYWAFVDGQYVWYAGYWGPSVGFYGGVDYGFGYYGTGYDGGYWDGGIFFYNSAVHNFGRVHVAHAYRKTIPATRSTRNTRVSFTGSPRGTAATPRPEEDNAARETHAPPVDLQVQHETGAAALHSAPLSVNRGRPPVAATSRPATFTGPGVVAARRAAPAPAPRPAPAARPPSAPAPAGHGEPEHH
ncbi:MAG TPA: YXWGXW repeat-containing protein [Stellaceae bacterium]|nr:YXWGXW repeat-containing protein [Stellaceae bacterium]